MRGRRLLVGLAAVSVVTVACGGDERDHATDATSKDEPLTATITARGLTAGLLDHLDRDRVTSYGGYHTSVAGPMESWIASADLDGDVRTVDVFVERTPDSYDPGCEPDESFYTELSCTQAPNGARRSLMQRTGGRDRMPLLQGRTTRADGTPVLVQLWTDEVTADARSLVLELLDDETIGILTTESLNAAGESLDDYRELQITTSIG